MNTHDPIHHAWQIERELRLSAVPLDRRLYPNSWYTSETVYPTGDALIALFWHSTVPGSGAPEIPYLEMVQAMGNKGYDVSKAEALLAEGLELAKNNGIEQGEHTEKLASQRPHTRAIW